MLSAAGSVNFNVEGDVEPTKVTVRPASGTTDFGTGRISRETPGLVPGLTEGRQSSSFATSTNPGQYGVNPVPRPSASDLTYWGEYNVNGTFGWPNNATYVYTGPASIPGTQTELQVIPRTASEGRLLVTLQATVASHGHLPVDFQGTITFKQAGQTLGVVYVRDNKAELDVELPAGKHAFSATYSDHVWQRTSQSNTREFIAFDSYATALKLENRGGNTRTYRPLFTATVTLADGTRFGAAPIFVPHPGVPLLIDLNAAPSVSASVLLQNGGGKRTTLAGTTNAERELRSTIVFTTGGTLPPGTDAPPYSLELAGKPPPSTPLPRGVVSFYAGDKLLGRAPVNPDGTAGFAPKKLPVGNHAIRAVYDGDGLFTSATSKTRNVRITETRTRTQLAASSTRIGPGEAIQLTATTSRKDSDVVTPSGRVSIYAGKQRIARLTLGAATGIAKLKLTPGTHTLRAVYEGDRHCQPSKSEPITLLVTGPASPKPVKPAKPRLR